MLGLGTWGWCGFRLRQEGKLALLHEAKTVKALEPGVVWISAPSGG